MDASERPSPQGLWRDVARVLVPRERIALRLDELAAEISARYDGREITLLAVLTGSLVFLADLIRRLPMPLRVDVISVRSYPDRATRSRGPCILGAPEIDVRGRDVLIVDDILDSGRTLRALRRHVEALGPASVRIAVLLRKRRPRRRAAAGADFVGFDVPDRFVVGYGLDFDNLYRNLPDICVLRPHEAEGQP